MATSSETCALTSRKYLAEQGMELPNLSEKPKFFLSHSSVFTLEKYPKNLNLGAFLPLKKLLEATLCKVCPLTFRKKYVAKPGKSIPHL